MTEIEKKIRKDIEIALEHLDRFAPTDEEAKLDFNIEMSSVQLKLEKRFMETLIQPPQPKDVENIHKKFIEKFVEQTEENDFFESWSVRYPDLVWQFFLPHITPSTEEREKE